MMKPTLTIDEVAKITGLTRNTIQVYSSRKKLGTKVGAQRLFTQADVKQLVGSASEKGRKKPAKTAKTAAKPKKKAAKKGATPRTAPARKSAARPAAAPRKAEPQAAAPAPKRSFFSFLGFGKKPAKAVKISDLVK
jgi:excisionase family DNA binding protein